MKNFQNLFAKRIYKQIFQTITPNKQYKNLYFYTSLRRYTKDTFDDDDIVYEDEFFDAMIKVQNEVLDQDKDKSKKKHTFWDDLWGKETKDATLSKIEFTHFYNGKPVPPPPLDYAIGTIEPNTARQAEILFRSECELYRMAFSRDEFPKDMNVPEVAFAGRSNVGKSSLINALLGRRKVTKVSSMPGRTRTINFYNLGRQTVANLPAMYLVDLPGYGHAEGNQKLIEEMNRIMQQYLTSRQSLKSVFLLIDSRHGVTEKDKLFMEMLVQAGVSHQIVLTKCDKISHKELVDVMNKTYDIIQKMSSCFPYIIPSSSATMHGIDKVRSFVFRNAGIEEFGLLLTKDQIQKRMKEDEEILKKVEEESKRNIELAQSRRKKKKKKKKEEVEKVESPKKEIKKGNRAINILGLDDD